MPHCISMRNRIQKESDEQRQTPSEPVKFRPEPEHRPTVSVATKPWTQQREGTCMPPLSMMGIP